LRDIAAVGTAYLAALSIGVAADRQRIIGKYYVGKNFTPLTTAEDRKSMLDVFDKAVRYTDLVTGDCVFG